MPSRHKKALGIEWAFTIEHALNRSIQRGPGKACCSTTAGSAVDMTEPTLYHMRSTPACNKCIAVVWRSVWVPCSAICAPRRYDRSSRMEPGQPRSAAIGPVWPVAR
jgi:hypothetical protein